MHPPYWFVSIESVSGLMSGFPSPIYLPVVKQWIE